MRFSTVAFASPKGMPSREAASAMVVSAHEASAAPSKSVGENELRFNPMSYHNGAVWPHDNSLLAAGAARYDDKAFAVKSYIAFDKQPEADVARIYDLYKTGNIFDRVPYVLAPAIKSIVAQQVDPRIAADLKAFDFHKIVDNGTVGRLVKEGYFEQLFGADVNAEEQRKAKIAF